MSTMITSASPDAFKAEGNPAPVPVSKTDEIKAGGVRGFLGLDQVDWGGKVGKFYECWKLEPCCGSPVNAKDAAICLGTWCCCGLCAQSKLYAASLGQSCAIVPHTLLTCICPAISSCFTRYNLRKKRGVPGNLAGDCICALCCGCCSGCQLLRASEIKDWALLPCNVVPIVKPVELIK
jgi:Cys-rich protein (TIGR01571 family)